MNADGYRGEMALALAGTSSMPRQPQIHCRNNRIEWKLYQTLGPRFRQY